MHHRSDSTCLVPSYDRVLSLKRCTRYDLLRTILACGHTDRNQIAWLQSPEAEPTIARFLIKYDRFFSIMASKPDQVVVPTVDIDLIWHTHQLSPRQYYKFTVAKIGLFVDHHDKVDEDKLSEAFEWTTKTYQAMYGEVYSECICWYCESKWPQYETLPTLTHITLIAIRAWSISSFGVLLNVSKQDKSMLNSLLYLWRFCK